MALACMAANGTGSPVLIDDVTADRNSRMNSAGYRAILSAQIQSNAAKLIGQHTQYTWIMTQNILQKQPESFLRQRNERFLSG